MARRELLHKSKLEGFKEWIKAQGWTIQALKGCYEVLRAVKPGEDTLILWTRNDAKEHYSVPDKWVSLIRMFINYERVQTKEEK